MIKMPENNAQHNLESVDHQPLSPTRYALISLIAFLIGIGLLLLFILKADELIAHGVSEKIFYVLLIPLGLSASAFLFGVMRSYAVYKGKQLGGMVELGGPIILFVVVVAGGFKLVPDTSTQRECDIGKTTLKIFLLKS